MQCEVYLAAVARCGDVVFVFGQACVACVARVIVFCCLLVGFYE